MTDVQMAWAAGFFDGEGCSTFNRHSKTMIVSVGQADLPLLNRFMASVGGRGRVRGPRLYPRRKPFYAWYANSYEALAVLELLWPYLGAYKRAQATAVISAYNSRDVKWKCAKGGVHLTCPKGHSLADAYVDRLQRSCRVCKRASTFNVCHCGNEKRKHAKQCQRCYFSRCKSERAA